MILIVVLGWIVFISVVGYRKSLETTRSDAHLKLNPWTLELPRSPALAGLVADLEAEGFFVIHELSAPNASGGTNQQVVVRIVAMLDRDGTTWAAPYQLTSLTPGDSEGPGFGFRVATLDLASMLESGRVVTTTNVALGNFDRNPKHSTKRLPMVRSTTELLKIHRDHLTEQRRVSPALDLRNVDFVKSYQDSWLASYEFQTTRGLFRREGDEFWATPKFVRRGVLNYWLPLSDPQGWRWLLHLGWTGLVVTGLGALLTHGALDARIPGIGLGALAGALGAAVFHPRSVIFTLILSCLSMASSGFDGAAFMLPALIAYVLVFNWRQKRDAKLAQETIEAHAGKWPASSRTPTSSESIDS